MKTKVTWTYSLFSFLFLFCIHTTFAQGVSINSTNASPDPSAGLDVDFTDRGFLLPRMTEAQRDAISNPALGLQLYNTDSDCFNIWTGSTWEQVCPDCSFPLPTVGNNGPICEGSTLNLTASTLSGAVYSWTGPNGFTSSSQNPSISNATSAANGIYSLQVTLNGCTSEPINTTVTVNGSPQTPTASNNGPVCEGGSINLSASNVVGAIYNWTGPNGYSASGQNPTLTNVTVSNDGVYNVIATVNGCQSAAGNTTVSILYIPSTPGSITGTTSTPSGSSESFSISAVAGATTYTWSVPSGWTINSGQGTTSIFVSVGTAGGIVSVTAGNTCGTSSASNLQVGVQYVYSENFVYNTSSPSQCTVWQNYMAGLSPSAYTKVTIKGSQNTTGITCTNVSDVQSLASALKNSTSYGFVGCDGNNWIANTSYGNQLAANFSGSCDGTSGTYIIRPCIGNQNWGGVDGTTCGAPSQTMTVIFE